MVTLPKLPKDTNTNTRGTRTDMQGAEDLQTDVKVKQDQKAICESKGGFWNEALKVCIMPEVTPEPEEKPKDFNQFTAPVGNQPKLIKDAEGKVIGVQRPGDETPFFGTPEDVQNLISNREASIGLPTSQGGTIGGPEAAAAANLQRITGQIGQIGALSAAEEADINFSQAATAGVAGTIPGIIGGAGGGATIGALGGPIGAVGGAILGGAGSFVAGLLSNIKEQQRGELAAAKTELTDARTNMRQLAMMASRDPANADVYISQYNQILTRVTQARRQTMVETSGDLNSWMEDGREDLARFDSFLKPGGIADIYGQKLAVSLSTGVPLSINGEELFLDEDLK